MEVMLTIVLRYGKKTAKYYQQIRVHFPLILYNDILMVRKYEQTYYVKMSLLEQLKAFIL